MTCCYLILENQDRLSREHIQPALLLALNLLQAGIRIVQLEPAEMIFDDKSDTMPVMMMMMELSRGHGESAIKSERNGAAWVEKRGKARAEGLLMTRCLPRWMEVKDGKPCLIPERAAIVKRIFQLAAAGYGNKLIVRRFMEEGVPAFGTSGKWVRNYLQVILADRRAVGEFQPRDTNGEPDGDPIPNYFPAVVSEDEFHADRAGAISRRTKPGRIGEGLHRHARDGGTYFCRTLGKKDRNRRVLMNSWAQERLAKCYSLDYSVFEEAVLTCLREINPHDILNGDTGPDETIVLAGELARVEALIAALAAELEHGDVTALARKLREKEAEKATLTARLTEVQQKAANLLSAAWGEMQSLAKAVEDARKRNDKDTLLRLRSAMRRIIDTVWLLIVPRGRNRLCAVQIWFAGGKKHRDYLLLHKPPMANKKTSTPGSWYCRSLAAATNAEDLDLRRPEDAEALAEVLQQMDLTELQTEERRF